MHLPESVRHAVPPAAWPLRSGPLRSDPRSRRHAPCPLTAELVVGFLHNFEATAQQHDFDLLLPMIHERAFFRFNEGDFIGQAAIRTVFEKTWLGSPGVVQDRFYLSDIVVLAADAASAAATYSWHWEGRQGEQLFKIQGRGTRVLVVEQCRLQIIHEHLSRFPAPAPAPARASA